MFALRLALRPTAGLTFRRVPFASTQMLTYPFVPAPTLSGYLERLRRLANGDELPETALKNPPTIALPAAYRVLGAYPLEGRYCVHRTARQGPRSINHSAFSRLHRQERAQTENFQLYAWEYLLAERLVGWVVHSERTALETLMGPGGLHGLTNFGCKLGKEGYAFVESAEIEALEPAERGIPGVAVPAHVVGTARAKIYPVYRYHREGEEITGYEPLRLALVDDVVDTPGYDSASGAFLPQASIDEL